MLSWIISIKCTLINFIKWGYRLRYTPDWSATYSEVMILYKLEEVYKLALSDDQYLWTSTGSKLMNRLNECIKLLEYEINGDGEQTSIDLFYVKWGYPIYSFNNYSENDNHNSKKKQYHTDYMIAINKNGKLKAERRLRLYYLLSKYLPMWDL